MQTLDTIRALWGAWLMADRSRRAKLAMAMEELRLKSNIRPELWRSFAATLPGYAEFESDRITAMIDSLFRR
jgi:hypothetical protein